MLMSVDQARYDDHSARIKGAIGRLLRHLWRTADAFDLAVSDQNESAGIYIPVAIDRHDITVLDQERCHSSVPMRPRNDWHAHFRIAARIAYDEARHGPIG
jgi:hypothetical protein